MRFFKSKTRYLVFGVFLITIFLGASYALLRCYSPARQFGNTYRQLRLGMSQDRVRELFGRTPDFECRYKSYQICYYRAPEDPLGLTFNDQFELKPGTTVQSLDDLPNVYDCVQLAFDAKGHLHAYTWIGETYTVESRNGSVSGSHFSNLSPSDF